MSDIREDLKAYLDGELSPERAALIEAALAADPSLQEEALFMRRLTDSFKGMTSGPQPVGAEAVLSRPRAPWLPRLLPFASAAVAILIVAVVAKKVMTSHSAEMSDAAATVSAPADMNLSMPEEMANGPQPKSIGGTFKDEGRARGGGFDTLAHKGADTRPQQPAPAAAVPPADAGVANRDVVRTGTIGVKVKNAAAAEALATALIKGWGGYVENSESTSEEAERPIVTMTARVPEKRFDDAMKEFEALGTRISKTVTGQDVTGQIVDMTARLKNLRAQEETYRQILRQARKMGEVLEVQQMLTQIRGEIEGMDAQVQSLKKLAALSTITLSLQQRPSGPVEDQKDHGWASDAWANATDALKSVCQEIATAVIWVFAYAPVWLPIAFVIWLATKRALRK